MKTKAFLFLLLILLMPLLAARAQAPDAAPVAVLATEGAAPDAAAPVAPAPDPNAPFRDSFFFTPLDIASIQRALGGESVSTALINKENQTVIPIKRVLSLAGVVFRKDDDWIVWLNGHKLTPKNLLPEIVDIDVEKNLVHLRWYDIGLNDIIAITLRPHQTYDIVTGLLLPGPAR